MESKYNNSDISECNSHVTKPPINSLLDNYLVNGVLVITDSMRKRRGLFSEHSVNGNGRNSSYQGAKDG